MSAARRRLYLMPTTGLALGVAMIVAALTTPIAAVRAAAADGPEGIFKLEHLIFIVQENRSFDHYFGTFPGADGFRMVNGKPVACVPDPALGHPSCVYHEHGLEQNGGPHDQRAADIDIDKGAMDGFIRAIRPGWCPNRTAAKCAPYVGPDLQPDVMSYHDGREIPNYWTYAKRFVLQDHMFAPSDSWTLPSHLFLVSGWSAWCSDPQDPMSCVSNVDLTESGQMHTYGADPIYAWTDITYLLHKAGVSWGYYVGRGTCSFGPCGQQKGPWGSTPPGKNPLPGFTDLYETGQQGNILTHPDFLAEAAAGTLPSVAWVVPGNNVSEHPNAPGGDIADGQAYVTKLVNAVMQGPDWYTSAIFLTWDDWGGFYDHMVPPVVDQNGYGLRVPGILVSPYAKQGFIDHQTLSFDAYLKLIEDRFLGGQRLDPSNDGRPDARPTVREDVGILGDLASEFDFTQTPRAPLILPPRS